MKLGIKSCFIICLTIFSLAASKNSVADVPRNYPCDENSIGKYLKLDHSDDEYRFGMFCVGYLYEYGGLSVKSDEWAREFYTIAARRGDSYGQAFLGSMYEKGIGGLSKNDQVALEYFQQSADQGNPYGQAKAARED
jgi:TPR repeat protein